MDLYYDGPRNCDSGGRTGRKEEEEEEEDDDADERYSPKEASAAHPPPAVDAAAAETAAREGRPTRIITRNKMTLGGHIRRVSNGILISKICWTVELGHPCSSLHYSAA